MLPENDREYLKFDPKVSYPRSADLFYECTRCGQVVPSAPHDNSHCSCYNIAIDVDAGRMRIEEPDKSRLFRERLGASRASG